MYLKCSINVSIVIITIIIESLTDTISLNSHNTPAKKVLSSHPIKPKEGGRKFWNLPVTEPVGGRAGRWWSWILNLRLSDPRA